MKSIVLAAGIILVSVFANTAYSQSKAPAYVKIYKSAKQKYKEGKYIEARILFQEVKKLALEDGSYGSTGPMIDYRIGLCYEKEGKYKKAVEHFQIYVDKANVVKGKMPPKFLIRKKIKLLKKKLSAGHSSKTIRDARVKELISLSRKARQYYDSKQYTTARNLFETVKRNAIALKMNTQSLAYIEYLIASCYEKERNYRMALNSYNAYLAYLRQGVKIRTLPDINSTLSIITRLKTKLAERENKGNYYSASVQRLITDGLTLCRQNKFYSGIKKLRYAKKLSLMDRSYHEIMEYYLGLCYESAGRYRDAVTYYKKYLAARYISSSMPSRAAVTQKISELENSLKTMTASARKKRILARLNQLYSRAHQYFQSGRYSDARRLYLMVKTQAKRINSYSPMIDYHIASSYDREGDYENAIVYYKIYLSASSLKPGWPSRKLVRSRVNILESEIKGYNGTVNQYGISGNSTGGNGVPGRPDPATPTTPKDNFYNSWLFYGIAAAVGVVVLIAVLQPSSDSAQRSPVAGPAPTPGFTVFRF